MSNIKTSGDTSGPTGPTGLADNYRIAASGTNVWLGDNGAVSFGIDGATPKSSFESSGAEFTPVDFSDNEINAILTKGMDPDGEQLRRVVEVAAAVARLQVPQEKKGAVVKPDRVIKPDRETPKSDMILYARSLEDELSKLARGAKWRLRVYRCLRFALLAASIVTPGTAIMSAPKAATIASALVVFICEGVLQITHINDRAVLDIRRLTGLGREYRMYRTRVGDYGGRNRDVLFVRRVEEIRARGDGRILEVLQQTFSSVGESASSAAKESPSGGNSR